VEQELPLERGRRELVPRHHENGPRLVHDAGAGYADELQQVVIGRQAKLEVGRAEAHIE